MLNLVYLIFLIEAIQNAHHCVSHFLTLTELLFVSNEGDIDEILGGEIPVIRDMGDSSQLTRRRVEADGAGGYILVRVESIAVTQSNPPPESTTQHIEFLAFPPEIRSMIYSYMIEVRGVQPRFSPQKPYGTPTPPQRDIGAMLSTCKKINEELAPRFYSQCRLVVYRPKLQSKILSRYGEISCSSLRQVEIGLSELDVLPAAMGLLSTKTFPSLKHVWLNMLNQQAFWDLLAQLTASPNAVLASGVQIRAEFLCAFGSVADWAPQSFEQSLFCAESCYRRAWRDSCLPNFAVPKGLESLVVKSLYADNAGALLRINLKHGGWAFLEDEGQLWDRDGSASCHRLRWISTEAEGGQELAKQTGKSHEVLSEDRD